MLALVEEKRNNLLRRIGLQRRKDFRTRARETARRTSPWVLAAAVGAILEYLFDPDRGKARRRRTRDQVARRVRRMGKRIERGRRRVSSNLSGMRQRMAHPVPPDTLAPDDATLKHKVESEIFGRPWVDKGKLNVDVSDAIVVLRGEVKSPDRMRALENAVRRIPGVLDVRSLLHLPRTPAPNVRDALAASEAARRDAPR